MGHSLSWGVETLFSLQQPFSRLHRQPWFLWLRDSNWYLYPIVLLPHRKRLSVWWSAVNSGSLRRLRNRAPCRRSPPHLPKRLLLYSWNDDSSECPLAWFTLRFDAISQKWIWLQRPQRVRIVFPLLFPLISISTWFLMRLALFGEVDFAPETGGASFFLLYHTGPWNLGQASQFMTFLSICIASTPVFAALIYKLSHIPRLKRASYFLAFLAP